MAILPQFSRSGIPTIPVANPVVAGWEAPIGQVVFDAVGASFMKVASGTFDWILIATSPDGLALPYRLVASGAFAVLPTDSTLVADTTAGNTSFTLPNVVTFPGKFLRFAKAALGNIVTLTPAGGQLIQGGASYILSDLGEFVVLQSDKTGGWVIFGRSTALDGVFQDHMAEERYVSRFDDIVQQSRVIHEVYFNFTDLTLRTGKLSGLVKFGGDWSGGSPKGVLSARVGGTDGLVDGTLIASITMADAAFNAYVRTPATSFVFTPPATGVLPVKLVLATPNAANANLQFSYARGVSLGFQRI